MIPRHASHLYPNDTLDMDGVPLVVFRDHRWILPVLAAARAKGRISVPMLLVSFDRHRDTLLSNGLRERFAGVHGGDMTFDEMVPVARDLCSPRDDDWITAGMEMGLIGDVVQFGTGGEGIEPNETYMDRDGTCHRLFRLGLPLRELAYGGALADREHAASQNGLWDVLGWNPRDLTADNEAGYVLDIDLDFFTAPWERYVLPFSEKVYAGEFFSPHASPWVDEIVPAEVLRGFARGASIITVATEPRWCGGIENCRAALAGLNRVFFDDRLKAGDLCIDFHPDYPTDEW